MGPIGSGGVLITVAVVDVITDVDLAVAAANTGSCSSAVNALYDSNKTEEISVLLDKR